MKKILYLLLMHGLPILPAAAQENGEAQNPNMVDRSSLPVPKEKNQLFYLQRDPNTNTIAYTLNLQEDGTLNEKKPINAYWIRYEDNGERRDLSFFQRNMAYGITHKKLDDNTYEFHITACKKVPLQLRYAPGKKNKATVEANGKTIMVDYIFVRIDGGSTLSPNIVYVEVGGTESHSKEPIIHRFDP